MLRRIISAHPAGVLLLAMDALGIVLAFNAGHWLHLGRFTGMPGQLVFGVVQVTLLVMYVGGVYRSDIEIWGLRLVIRTVLSVAVAGTLTAALTYVTKASDTNMLFWRGTLIPSYLIFMAWAVVCQ